MKIRFTTSFLPFAIGSFPRKGNLASFLLFYLSFPFLHRREIGNNYLSHSRTPPAVLIGWKMFDVLPHVGVLCKRSWDHVWVISWSGTPNDDLLVRLSASLFFSIFTHLVLFLNDRTLNVRLFTLLDIYEKGRSRTPLSCHVMPTKGDQDFYIRVVRNRRLRGDADSDARWLDCLPKYKCIMFPPRMGSCPHVLTVLKKRPFPPLVANKLLYPLCSVPFTNLYEYKYKTTLASWSWSTGWCVVNGSEIWIECSSRLKWNCVLYVLYVSIKTSYAPPVVMVMVMIVIRSWDLRK